MLRKVSLVMVVPALPSEQGQTVPAPQGVRGRVYNQSGVPTRGRRSHRTSVTKCGGTRSRWWTGPAGLCPVALSAPKRPPPGPVSPPPHCGSRPEKGWLPPCLEKWPQTPHALTISSSLTRVSSCVSTEPHGRQRPETPPPTSALSRGRQIRVTRKMVFNLYSQHKSRGSLFSLFPQNSIKGQICNGDPNY